MNFLEFIRHYQYTHIPSALSQIYYLNHIFSKGLVTPYTDSIVLAKPFGHAAYYYIWQKYGMIGQERYSDGVRDTEIDFVDFSDVTIGNALGVSSGIEIGREGMTYVNMSDSQLQMGSVVEAIQFIGRRKQNIKLTIDYNRQQLTSNLLTNISADKSLFLTNGWNVFDMVDDFRVFDYGFGLSGPVVFFAHTEKGDGIPEMQSNPSYWHYKSVDKEILTMTDKLRNL